MVPIKKRSLFEYEDKMQKISAFGDPLERLNKIIPWEKIFSPIIDKILTKEEPLGTSGQPRFDYILILKVLIIQRTCNLSDEQTEYQINDRLSFQRFLGIDLCSNVPDDTTILKFREILYQ
jgi:transposase, IS5 family